MLWDTDHTSILSGIGLAPPSHLLEQLGLTALCMHGHRGAEGKYQGILFLFHLFFKFSVSVFYKVKNMQKYLYYRCMLNKFFIAEGMIKNF